MKNIKEVHRMKSGWEPGSAMNILGNQESILESQAAEIVALERHLYQR